MKVLFLDEQGGRTGEWSSQQIEVDNFTYSHGLQEPPFPLEQLAYLAETHPTHGAALEQRAQDVIGAGWEWDAPADADAKPELRDELDAWWRSLGDDPDEDQPLGEALV